MSTPTDETEGVRQRYARRAGLPPGRYSLLDAAALRERQGRQRALARLLRQHGVEPAGARLAEVGCGSGCGTNWR